MKQYKELFQQKKNDFFPLNENIHALYVRAIIEEDKKITGSLPSIVQLLFVGIIYVKYKLRLRASYVIIL